MNTRSHSKQSGLLAMIGVLTLAFLLTGCGSMGAVIAGAAINAVPEIIGGAMFSEDESAPYPTDDLVDAAEATLRKAMQELPDDPNLRIAVIPILDADSESLTVIGDREWWASEVSDLMNRSCTSDIWINPQLVATKSQQLGLHPTDTLLAAQRERVAKALAYEGQPVDAFLLVNLRINAQRQAPAQELRAVRASINISLQETGPTLPTELATRNFDTEAGGAWWREALNSENAETTASQERRFPCPE